jgi:hypothetical protein
LICEFVLYCLLAGEAFTCFCEFAMTGRCDRIQLPGSFDLEIAKWFGACGVVDVNPSDHFLPDPHR